MDTYAIVTEKIINLLEQEIVPWRRPWSATGQPCNLVTRKPYRGINYFLLSASKFVSPFWLTLKQANQLGGLVRKGEQSTMIVFCKVDQAPNDDEPTMTKTGQTQNADSFSGTIGLSTWNNVIFHKQSSINCRKSRPISTILSKWRSGSSRECPIRPR